MLFLNMPAAFELFLEMDANSPVLLFWLILSWIISRIYTELFLVFVSR